MGGLICDTSVLQYLYQVDLLPILPQLADKIIIAPAVAEELTTSLRLGYKLPDPASVEWIEIHVPQSLAVLAMVGNLGKGETQTLALGVEIPESVVVLDDNLARRAAELLDLKFTGTLGLLLEAKRVGALASITTVIDHLEGVGFRLAERTRKAVLKLAGEV